MKKCIITGGNSGIGFEAAKQIMCAGFHVTILCRNKDRAQQAVSGIIEQTGISQIDYLIADLSDIHQIRTAAEQYLSAHEQLDVLINNAADFDLSIRHPVLTAEGIEKQFAVNVAAPFLLSSLLLDSLKKSHGRIINISSKGLCVYPFIKLDFENLNGQKHYSPADTYYQNKLALLMISLYLRDMEPGVLIQAVRVPNVKIDISRYGDLSPVLKKMYAVKSQFSISPEQMAKVYTALASEDCYHGFLYDEKLQEVKANRNAYDKEEQKRLYEYLSAITL